MANTLGSRGREIHKLSPGRRGREWWGHGSIPSGAHPGPLTHWPLCLDGGIMALRDDVPSSCPSSITWKAFPRRDRHFVDIFFHGEDAENSIACGRDEAGS